MLCRQNSLLTDRVDSGGPSRRDKHRASPPSPPQHNTQTYSTNAQKLYHNSQASEQNGDVWMILFSFSPFCLNPLTGVFRMIISHFSQFFRTSSGKSCLPFFFPIDGQVGHFLLRWVTNTALFYQRFWPKLSLPIGSVCCGKGIHSLMSWHTHDIFTVLCFEKV